MLICHSMCMKAVFVSDVSSFQKYFIFFKQTIYKAKWKTKIYIKISCSIICMLVATLCKDANNFTFLHGSFKISFFSIVLLNFLICLPSLVFFSILFLPSLSFFLSPFLSLLLLASLHFFFSPFSLFILPDDWYDGWGAREHVPPENDILGTLN